MDYQELVIKMHALCYGMTDPGKIELSIGGLPKRTLGRTSFDIQDGEHIATIQLNSKLSNTEDMIVGVLWHEICHATPWINNGKTDGHSWAWICRFFKRPYWAIVSVLTDIWFGIVDP